MIQYPSRLRITKSLSKLILFGMFMYFRTAVTRDDDADWHDRVEDLAVDGASDSTT
jgi:hypothetical protein